MNQNLITKSFITGLLLLNCHAGLSNESSASTIEAKNILSKNSPALIQVNPPLASTLAQETVKPSAAPQTQPRSGNTEAGATKKSVDKKNTFLSEKKTHALSKQQLAEFNNHYLANLSKKADLITPILRNTLSDQYDLFSANYRVQGPMIWTGEILSGWGMLPHSGGRSRAEFFIHSNGKVLVVITQEKEQFIFGASSLKTNSYVAQELATSSQSQP